MVRGVHKKIIEVADTQNEFFERAILIVKEGFREEDPERLRQKALLPKPPQKRPQMKSLFYKDPEERLR